MKGLKDPKTGRFVNNIESKSCIICAKEFKSYFKAQQACSRKCGQEHKRRTYINPQKGKRRPPEVGLKISQSRKGMKFSLEHKEKLRLARLGKPRPGNPEKWKHNLESKLKNSLAHRGERSVNWKGGVSLLNKRLRRSLQYRLWRKSVFERDEYKCILCGADKKYLNADHIKQYAVIIKENGITTYEQAIECEELWQVSNGRTLCIDCHSETDTYLNRGKKNGV